MNKIYSFVGIIAFFTGHYGVPFTKKIKTLEPALK